MRSLLGCGVLAWTLIACGPTEEPATAPDGAEPQPAEPAALEIFSWPEDPSHPVLEILVESSELSGTIRIELMPELAPATVTGILELAEEGFYDGTTFHRVIPDFMIQGGDPLSRDRDPTNDGTGRSGRTMKDEFSRAPFLRGVVGLGNKGRENSTSSQFFIMHADKRNLDGRYNAVGRVLEGIEIVDAITQVEIDRSGRWGPRDRPIENVVMTRVRPVGSLSALAPKPDAHAVVGSLQLAQPRTELGSTDPKSQPDVPDSPASARTLNPRDQPDGAFAPDRPPAGGA